MKSKKVLRYYCDHCNRGHWKKSGCLEHEERCYFNPKNRKCGSCSYFSNFACDYHCDRLVSKKEFRGLEIDGIDTYGFMVFPEKCDKWTIPF